MKMIDERAIPSTVAFGDLAIGDAFQDKDYDINIKTGINTSIYWIEDHWATLSIRDEELVIPLEVTYVVKRREE